VSFRVGTPVLLFLVAMGVRLLSWHSVFQKGGVYLNGNDAYYHLRRIRYSIDHFPNVLTFDPLINFPSGAQPIWPPTFDWLIAALLRFFPGIDQAGQLERLVAFIPPIVGAGTVLFVYFIGLRFFSRSVAIVAAMSMAIMPAHALYSRLGAVDHHFLVAGLVAVMLALGMALFRDASASEADGKRIGLSVGLGLSIAAAVLVWPGSLLHVSVLQVAMVLRLVTAVDSDAAKAWALRFSVVHAVACLAVYPMSAGNEWVLWGPLSPVVLTDFQPLYFFVAAACFGVLYVVWRMGWGSRTRLTRLISSAALGSAVLIGMLLAIPDLNAAFADALSWFAKNEEFQSSVSESVPLFGGPAGSARAEAFLGGFVYAVPFAIAYLGWQFRGRADVLLLIGWGLALFLATLVQWRFMNSYSIAHCLFIGITFESIHHAMQSRLTAFRGIGGTVLAMAILLLLFVPPIRAYGPHFANLSRSLRGEETIPTGSLLRTRFIADAARFLRDHSPPPEEARYSVLGPWGDGHILKTIAERAIVQDNFGDDVAPENFRRGEEYFASESESQALRIVSPVDTRYVLVRSTGSGHSSGYSADSLFSRLYHLKGSRGRPPRRRGGHAPMVSSLGRHRLIYQSAPLNENDPKPFVMLFEIVEGAELMGHADPGAVVKVSLVSPDIQSGDHYVVRVGEQSAEVVVSESAVSGGAQITAPTFGK